MCFFFGELLFEVDFIFGDVDVEENFFDYDYVVGEEGVYYVVFFYCFFCG